MIFSFNYRVFKDQSPVNKQYMTVYTIVLQNTPYYITRESSRMKRHSRWQQNFL